MVGAAAIDHMHSRTYARNTQHIAQFTIEKRHFMMVGLRTLKLDRTTNRIREVHMMLQR